MRKQFFQLQDGRRLVALRTGAEGGVPVLALHGWLDNADSFAPMAAFMAGVDLVCLDLAGHGESDYRPGINPYLIVNDLAELQQVVDQLGWQRFGLLGHSRGAIISCLLAAALPERVQALGLIDGLWPQMQPPEALVEQVRKTLGQSLRAPRAYDDLESMLRSRCQHGFGLGAEAAKHLLSRGVREQNGKYYWAYDPLLRQQSMLMLCPQQFEQVLQEIAAPVELVVASQGLALVEPALAEKLLNYSQINWQWFEGGHHLHMEQQAESLARHFGRFFRHSALPR